jgi:beta-N-acetylhexosaminidase
MKRLWLLIILFIQCFIVSAQNNNAAQHWVDSVFNTLSTEEKIAQLMIIRAHSNLGKKHEEEVAALIQTYNVGGLCFFQGGPVRQAKLTNYYQTIAKTPLMVTIDGEWGLGMRLDSVQSLPRQLMLGASPDAGLAYRYGKLLADQCKRMGIQVNYAPVVDVNNNPANPVINDRSFGEDKYKVALFGKNLVKGMEDQGVMACAKHFPGHGDTETDSHYDLPVIQKKRPQLDTLELYPFKELFANGVGSTMVGHLSIPDIDSTPHIATSISRNNVTGLLKEELGFKGLIFTDAIEMKGVQKFFPGGEASVKALQAGNDLLCLPVDVPATILQIKKALRHKKINKEEFNQKVKKVLAAKYHLDLANQKEIDTTDLTTELNRETDSFIKETAEHAITLLKNKHQLLPFDPTTLSFLSTVKKQPVKVAYLAMGVDTFNFFCRKMKSVYGADIFLYKYQHDAGNVLSWIEILNNHYDYIVIGLHKYSRRPANQFGIGPGAMQLIKGLMNRPNCIMINFGNPYVLSNFCDAPHMISAYEDHPIIQEVAFEIFSGKRLPMGSLPVTVCQELPAGTELSYTESVPALLPKRLMDEARFQKVDSIVHDAIQKKAMPGCVVLAAQHGKIIYEKAFGHTRYDSLRHVNFNSIYDLASVTKVMATTLAVMKLYEEGLVDLDKPLATYMPALKRMPHGKLIIRDLLLHQSGLPAWIPFYKDVIDTITGFPDPNVFSDKQSEQFNIPVAANLYARRDLQEELLKKISLADIMKKPSYVYSDLGFIYLGKLVESISGMTIDRFVSSHFYDPLSLHNIGYLPKEKYPLTAIVPTEHEKKFRCQLLWGTVHDPAAALMGGVAGHAGLFGSVYDAAVLMQVILNGGRIGDIKLLKPETISLFTSYQSEISRRGFGFDKPEKDNDKRAEPYPCKSISSEAFGHTGFTGICVWADPQQELVFILLSNRVHPSAENTLFGKMNIRGKVLQAVYDVIK